jgi:[acyl-carrier-protein] S-malonyltransferase
VLAVIAPGQGAQRAGFLQPWLELGAVADYVRALEKAADIGLIEAGTGLSESDITDTAVAQPLIVAAGLATAAALGPLPADTVFAGHSVGEYTAASLAGALDPSDAMRLVGIRGAAMAAASAAAPSGMAAVLGGDEETVVTAIAAAGCTAANFNGAGQIVAAGPKPAIERLSQSPPAGARVRPLAVAGAFHTPLMSTAQHALAAAAVAVTLHDSPSGLVSNRDGLLVQNGRQIRDRLVEQVCLPVRWDACVRAFATLGVTATIELAPAGTLTGLVKRALPHVTTVALRGPDDLPAARAVIDEHGVAAPAEAPGWRVVVSPAGGTVRLPASREETLVRAGEVVAHVATRTDEVPVTSADHGRIIELLVHDGDPVSAGQPLARISPDER